MGNLCNCCEKEEEYSDVFADERARLLSNPVAADRIFSNSGNQTQSQQHVYSRSGDVNAMLTNIIDSVAGRVVDVGVAEENTLEEQDFMERDRYYGELTTHLKLRLGSDLPRAAGNPVLLFAAPPVSEQEMRELHNVAKRCHELVTEMEIRDKEKVLALFSS